MRAYGRRMATSSRPLRLAVQAPGIPEIFKSVQGEGRSAGRIRTFVRLSGCNLYCTWCDTAYTWNWRDNPRPHVLDRPGAPHAFVRAEEELRLDVDTIADRIVAMGAEGVVITGGEPLGQMAGVASLIAAIRARQPGAAIEIETNGTIAPSEALVQSVNLFMVSPKLGHAGVDARLALRPKVLRGFAGQDSAFFKFVARDATDVDEVAALADRIGIPRDRVYIMPEGTTATALDRVGAGIVDAVIGHGFAYSDRLHIRLFGDKRGV
jgi:7-carboxy-7-deazaguanine synthase